MADRKKKKPVYSSDQDLLDEIKNTIVQMVKEGKINLKVSDLLKILEIQKKLGEDGEAKDKFWELIDQIRREELNNE